MSLLAVFFVEQHEVYDVRTKIIEIFDEDIYNYASLSLPYI